MSNFQIEHAPTIALTVYQDTEPGTPERAVGRALIEREVREAMTGSKAAEGQERGK